MTDDVDAVAGVQVDVLVAVDVPHLAALAAIDPQWDGGVSFPNWT